MQCCSYPPNCYSYSLVVAYLQLVKNDPDAALLVGFESGVVYYWRKLICVAKGNAASSAMVFFSETSEVTGVTFLHGPEDQNYSADKLQLTYQNWDKVLPFTTTVGKQPLLDYRWEGMQHFSTYRNEEAKLPAPAGAHWTLNLSVKGRKDAFIYLCSNNNIKSSCCWVIFGGWENTKSGYRIIKKGLQSSNKTDLYRLNIRQWNHVTLEVTEDNLKLRLGKFNLEVKINFDIKHVIFTTSRWNKESVEWRIHNQSFMSTSSRNNHIQSNWFLIGRNGFCLSFFYYIPLSLQNAKLTIEFFLSPYTLIYTEDITDAEEDKNRGWKRFKKTFDIAQDGEFVLVQITAKFDGDFVLEDFQDLFAVDDIKLCIPEENFRAMEVSLTTTDYNDLPSCQLLQFPESVLVPQAPQNYRLGCKAGHLLSNCSVTCDELFGQDHMDCTKVSICVPRSGNTFCSCSKGHSSPDCYKCPAGHYGDFCSGECGYCKNNRNCNWATGECPTGCESGFAPPLCNITFPKLNKAPVLVGAFPSSLSFFVDFTDFSGYGQPTNYQIQYKDPRSRYDRTWTSVEQHPINDKKANVTLDNLKKLSKYNIRVILFVNGDKYDENDVPEFEGTTTCEDIQVDDIVPDETSVEVHWSSKDPSLACPLSYYSVTISGKARNTETLPIHGGSYPKFTSLEPYTEYTVEVLDERDAVLYMKTISTLEAAPTVPLNLRILSVSGNDSTIMWDKPSKTNGKLTRFNVMLTMRETWLIKGTVPEIRDEYKVIEEHDNYTYVVEGLYPSTVYLVSVSGETVVPGPPATCNLKTPLVEPVYFEKVALVSDTLTSSTAEVTLPPASEYVTNTSAYFVMVGCDSCLDGEKSSVPLLRDTLWQELLNHSRLGDCDDKWIAAEIKPESHEVNFTIGNNTKTDGHIFGKKYVNRPLDVRTTYTIVVVVVNQQEDDTKFTTLKPPQVTLNLFIALNLTDEAGTRTNSGLIVFIVLLVIIVPLLGYFMWKKRNTFLAISKLKPAVQLTLPKVDDQSYILKPPAPDPPAHNDELEASVQKLSSEQHSCRVAIEDLENYVTRGTTSGVLQKQYMMFPRGQTQPWDYGKLPQNKSKNRYGNLVAYDSSRVILQKLPDDEYSDYINANYIDGYKTKRMYIATQGPKPTTVDDFWRMVWQEEVHIISMLANLLENGKKKCEQYWPDCGKETTHGSVTIFTESEQVFADFTIRNLNVTCEGIERKIVHLHFTCWPDHGVPFYPQSVAGYLKKLLATPKGKGPIIVHCSAGVGRTGTIILADICLRMAAAEKAVDTLLYLQIIREQRPNMVDNFEQFMFVHLVLIECLVEDHTSYSCSGLGKHVKQLRDTGALMKQFQRLEELRMQNHIVLGSDPNSETQSKQSPLLHKNRSQDVVPGRSGRVYLARNPVHDNFSDYINAVYVDGFHIRDQFIVTQYPLPSTVGDFWRMVAEKNISLIVMLNDLDASETVPEFRPMADEIFTPVPHLKVRLKQKSSTHSWSMLKLQITDSSCNTGVSQHQVVRMIHLTGWSADSDLPQEPSVLIHLWQEVETHYSGKGPTLVMCMDGARACGLFLGSTFLIEKMKLEQQCDVCHAVRTIRQNRKQFIRTQEQFEFLYDVAIDYLEAFSIYSNFD